MNTENKIELFENTPVVKAVMRLSVPTVMATLVMVLYNLADTLFVGRLNDPYETAAVTLAGAVILSFNAVSNLFGVGGASMMSRAMGLKDYETVKRTAAFGFYCALFASLLLSVFTSIFQGPLLKLLGATPDNGKQTSAYLFWTVSLGAVPAILNVVLSNYVRSEGASLHASVGVMSGCVLNIILDPVFILPKGFGMGAAGAGLATFISNTVAVVYFLIYIFCKRKTTFVRIHPKYLRPTKMIVKEVFKVGVPASIQNLLNVTGMTILNNFASAYGSEAVSAIGISHKITMIPMYVSMGVTQGVMPLIGYNFASKNVRRMKKAVTFTTKISIAFMLAATVLYYIFAGGIVGLFMKNETIVSYGAIFTRGMCLAQPFLAMDFLAVAVFQACGMGGKSLLFAVLRKIVLEIPAIIVLNRLFPMVGLAYSQLFAEVILAAAAILMLRKIFRDLKPYEAKNVPTEGEKKI